MSKRTIVLLAVFAVVYFLIRALMTAPATLLVGQLAERIPNLQVQGVSGTLWSGGAANIAVNLDGSDIQLGKTEWELAALPLLWGSADLSVQAERPRQSVEAKINASVFGSVSLNDTDVTVPAEMLRQWLPLPAEIGGQLSLRLNSLQFTDQRISDMDGNVSWQNAEINMTGAPITLGSYVAELSVMDDGTYHANVFDLGGAALGIKGAVDYQPQQKMYSVDADLTPGANLDANLKAMIGQFGQANAQGALHIKTQGNL